MSDLLLKTILLAKAIQLKGQKPFRFPPIPKPKVKQICRICSKEEGTIPIFENPLRPSLSQEIEKFSGYAINKSNGLSTSMCKICLKLLDCSILFRKLCQESNKLLSEHLLETKTNDVIVKKECAEDYVWVDVNYDNVPMPAETSLISQDSDNETSLNKVKRETKPETVIKMLKTRPIRTKIKKEQKTVPKKPKVPKETTTKRIWKRRNLPKVGRSCLCNICGKTLSSPACLAEHMATHATEFPYECHLCPYKARHRGLLHVHKRTHLPEHERPYKCSQCTKRFASATNMLSHMRRIHSTERFKCDQCDRTFTCPQYLNSHIRVVHLPAENVSCEICGNTYPSKRNLGKHRRKVHKIKLCEGNTPHNMPTYLQHSINMDGEMQKEQIV